MICIDWESLTKTEDIEKIMDTLYHPMVKWDFSYILDNPGIRMKHYYKLYSELEYDDFTKLGDITKIKDIILTDIEFFIKEHYYAKWITDNHNIYKMVDYEFFKKHYNVPWNMLLMAMHCKLSKEFLDDFSMPADISWEDAFKKKYLDSFGLSLHKDIHLFNDNTKAYNSIIEYNKDFYDIKLP